MFDVGKNASKVKRALRVRRRWNNLMVVILGGMEKKEKEADIIYEKIAWLKRMYEPKEKK